MAVDEISLTYRKAETRYGHGEGILTPSQSGDFSLSPGDSIPFAYTGAMIRNKEGNTIYLRGEDFVYSFLAPRPSGHGYYTISFDLPETEPEKEVVIRLEEGKKVIRSNVDFDLQREGDYLILTTITNENSLEISFITELTYMLLSSILAAFIVGLVLLSFIIMRRADIKSNIIRMKEEYRSFFELEKKDGSYRLSLDISILIAGFLFIVFFKSIMAPLLVVWPGLGLSPKIVFIVAIISLSILSGFFLLTARDENAVMIRLSVIGAGIVGIITFAYLGATALILSGITGVLIYLLSVVMLEEDESEKIVKKG